MKKNEENCIGGYGFKHGDYKRSYLGVNLNKDLKVLNKQALSGESTVSNGKS